LSSRVTLGIIADCMTIVKVTQKNWNCTPRIKGNLLQDNASLDYWITTANTHEYHTMYIQTKTI